MRTLKSPFDGEQYQRSPASTTKASHCYCWPIYYYHALASGSAKPTIHAIIKVLSIFHSCHASHHPSTHIASSPPSIHCWYSATFQLICLYSHCYANGPWTQSLTGWLFNRSGCAVLWCIEIPPRYSG